MNRKIDICKGNARYAQEEIDLRLGKSFTVHLTNELQTRFENDRLGNVSTSYGP